MSTLSVQPAYPIFNNKDGTPLHNGYIHIGVENLDATTNPIAVYWDAALTITAPQPIRTIYGYPSRDGSPARLYVNSNYSIKVQDQNANLVYSAPSVTERYSAVTTDSDVKFNTVADLKASDFLISGQEVETKSYYNSIPFLTANQGGGGKYRIMTASEYGLTPDEYGAAFTLGNGNIAVLQHNGYVSDLQYGVIRDGDDANAGTNGVALQALFDASKLQGFVANPTKGVARCNTPLVVDRTLATIIGAGKKQSMIRMGTGFPVGERLLTIRDCGRTDGTGTGEQPTYTGNEKLGIIKGFTLDGFNRQIRAHGLYFEGLNDDCEVDVSVWNFKGKGLQIGDTTSGTSAVDVMRESTFHSIEVKNCGNVTGGFDDEAIAMGSPNASTDGTNNLWFNVCRVVYPRGVGIRIIANSSHRTRKINMDTVFLHGNEQLPAGNDGNGEPWRSNRNMIEVGVSGATGNNVSNLFINKLDMIGLESTGLAALIAYDGSSWHVNSHSGLAPNGSKFFKVDGGSSCTLKGYCRENNFVGSTANSTSNLLEVVSMDTNQSYVTVSGLAASTVPLGAPSYVGSLGDIQDDNLVMVSHPKSTDAAATDNLPLTTIIPPGRRLYFQRLQFTSGGSLTADASNYATLEFFKLLSGGTIGALVASITTQPSGTGSFVAGNGFEIPFTTNRTDKGEGLIYRITKTGTGVIFPAGSITAEMSPNLSLI